MKYLFFRDDKDMTITNLIRSKLKTVETRPRDVLKQIHGERVGLVVTLPNKKRFLFGYAEIGKPVVYHNEQEFDADYNRHRIGKDSPWYKHKGVGYELIDPVFIPIMQAPPVLTGNRSYYTSYPL